MNAAQCLSWVSLSMLNPASHRLLLRYRLIALLAIDCHLCLVVVLCFVDYCLSAFVADVVGGVAEDDSLVEVWFFVVFIAASSLRVDDCCFAFVAEVVSVFVSYSC